MTLLVLEVAQIIPYTGSDSVTIPLTFFDLPWLLVHPFKQVFFYRQTASSREHFHSFILPKLKFYLSLVLSSYLPLSGCITWNPNELKPSIVVSQNDAILVTIAESESDFSHLSGYGQRPASELHTLIPKLPFSDESATVFSLQITLFPNQGFSIGFAAHHAVLDGKTASMFIKDWARLCKQQEDIENRVVIFSLPPPSLDRSSLLNDVTAGIDEQMIEIVKSKSNNMMRSLNRNIAGEIGDDVVLATLVLSRDDVERLRERCRSSSRDDLHLSAFVIAYAYAWICFVKARGGNGERLVSLLVGADFRNRLDPPLPANYFGNCLYSVGCYKRKAADFAGFITAVEILSDLVKSLSSQSPGMMIETIAQGYAIGFESIGESSQVGTVAMSNKFGVYESDFGWGRPVKVDFVSIRGEGIAMAESRDESGGVEIGICMNKTDFDIVFSFFNNGLQN